MVDSSVLSQFTKILYIESNRLVLQQTRCDYDLQIMFSNCQVRKVSPNKSKQNYLKKIKIKAVYGIIQMETNSYLVVVTKSTAIGQIFHSKIYQMLSAQFICIGAKPSSSDSVYINGLKQIFNTKCYYFSDDYDLTKSLQEYINSGKSTTKAIKTQFMVNSDWVNQFYQLNAQQWITIFIEGYINIIFKEKNNSYNEMILISRRDKRRQGMRYLRRGIDIHANTANTVESEIIFSETSDNKQNIFSYVQLRGSMPFIWKQDPDLRWSPKCVISGDNNLNKQKFQDYYKQIKKYYENITLINLVDKKGQQYMLGQYFQKLHNQLNDKQTKLIWFDFHKECKNMKYQNLGRLLDQIKTQIENYGYFNIQINKTKQTTLISKKRSQKGIIRTNCMDCLDRTNVVQCVIARQLILQWIRILNNQQKKQFANNVFEVLPLQLQQSFRNQWTENADKLSILYSGTPAMKTDFTLTGKRTIKGSLKDGYYGMKRYFLGNFYDSRKQDIIDFSLNKLKPKKKPQQRIRFSIINSFYLYIILIIIIPFLTYWGLKQVKKEENQSILSLTIAGGILGIALFLKLTQYLKMLFIRSPLKKSFQ